MTASIKVDIISMLYILGFSYLSNMSGSGFGGYLPLIIGSNHDWRWEDAYCSLRHDLTELIRTHFAARGNREVEGFRSAQDLKIERPA